MATPTYTDYAAYQSMRTACRRMTDDHILADCKAAP
jgi:hypothetical protein